MGVGGVGGGGRVGGGGVGVEGVEGGGTTRTRSAHTDHPGLPVARGAEVTPEHALLIAFMGQEHQYRERYPLPPPAPRPVVAQTEPVKLSDQDRAMLDAAIKRYEESKKEIKKNAQ